LIIVVTFTIRESEIEQVRFTRFFPPFPISRPAYRVERIFAACFTAR